MVAGTRLAHMEGRGEGDVDAQASANGERQSSDAPRYPNKTLLAAAKALDLSA